MDWTEVGKNALVVVPAVTAPAVSLVTLILKIRESNGRTRAHTIAAESYALAKAIGELGPGDAGSAHAPYLRNDLLRSGNVAARQYLQLSRVKRGRIRNWIDATVYSVMCLFFGVALLQFPRVFEMGEGPWASTWYLLGGFFIAVGAYVFVALATVIARRRKALFRLLRQWLLRRRPRTGQVRTAEPATSDAS